MKPTDLRAILQYIPRFREKIFVISLDGAIVIDENIANILVDVAVLRSVNIHVVLVHGAAAQIQALAKTNHATPSDLDGSGVTDEATLDLALTASNRLTHELLEGLAANDLRAACGNAIVAYPLGIIQGVNHLFTGRVERVDTQLLRMLLDQGIVPVIPPLGFDGDGKTYRLNSDRVAQAVAETLRATKLIFISSQDGLIRQGSLIRQILAADLEALVELHSNEFDPQILSKASHAAAACRNGVPRVHLINGRMDEALLAEIFSNEGVGTLVYANEYQQIRRAMKKDIRTILGLIKNSVVNEELVKRTRAAIEKQLQDYYIFEIDKNPVGCVALHTYPEDKKGELACLVVRSTHENLGIGRKLISYIEETARHIGLTELVVLSTQTFTYFQSKGGFYEGGPADLPASRREKYAQSGRNSKVLVKKLTGPSIVEAQRRVA